MLSLFSSQWLLKQCDHTAMGIWELAKQPGDSTLSFLSLWAISLSGTNLYQNREQLSSYQSGKDRY